MRDVLLWKALHEVDVDADILAELLEELAEAPVERRAIFAQGVLGAVAHDAPAVRAAAARALGGGYGRTGMRAIAARLDDPHKDVRAAAVLALADASHTDGAPFAAALFHRRIDVRRRALDVVAGGKPQRTQLSHVVLLLADPEHQDDVRAVLDARAAEGAAAAGVLAARRHGFFDDVEVYERLKKIPFAKKAAEVFAGMPFPATIDAHVATPEAVRGYLTGLVHTDPLADALAVLWRHPAPPATFAVHLSDDAPIVEELIAARRALEIKDAEHRRLAVCIAQVMLTTGESSPRMLAFAALAAPALLLCEPDLARRRAAIRALVDVAGHATVGRGVTLKLLLDRGAFSRSGVAGGVLDTRALAGGLRLMFDAPYQRLREAFPAAQVADAFWANTTASSAADAIDLLTLSPRTPTDREAYRALCKAVVVAHRARLTPPVLRDLCLALPAEGGFSLEDVEKGGAAGVVAETLALLLADKGALAVDELGLRRLERNAGTLAAQLTPASGAPLLAAVSALSAATASPVSAAVAEAVLRAFPKATLPEALAALSAREVEGLVVRLSASVFPVDVERAWAAVLDNNGGAAAKAWALPRLAIPDAPRAVAPGVAHKIAAGPAADVPLLAAVFLREPLTGLVEALAARPASSPASTIKSARLAAALLASHDPPHAVADAFQQAIVEEPPFLAAVDQALLDEDTRRELPLLATAWVHHDAGQAVRFEHFCRTAPGGLRAIIDIALALPSPLLSWKLMRALVEVVRAWTFQRKGLLDKLDDRVAEIAFAILTRAAEPRPSTGAPSTFHGARAMRRLTAELVALAHGSGRAAAFVDELKKKLGEQRPDLESDVRALLAPVVQWTAAPAPPPTPEVASARLRSMDVELVKAAVDEIAKTGSSAPILDALTSAELPGRFRTILERAILDDADVARLLRDDVDAEVRFRVAARVGDWKAALAAAAAPSKRAWLSADDVTALAAQVKPHRFAVKLARSPHPEAYNKAVWSLLSTVHDEIAAAPPEPPRPVFFGWDLDLDPVPHPGPSPGGRAGAGNGDDGKRPRREPLPMTEARQALHDFLEAGDDRDAALRAEVAAALLDAGERVDAVVVRCALDAPEPRHESKLRDAVSTRLWLEVIESAGVLGVGALDGALEALMEKRLVNDDVCAAVALHLLKRGVDEEDARPLFAVLRRARFFDDPRVDDLREAVQWGIRQARVLMGKPVGVEFISDALGYTRLHQPRIFINPMPLLRGERGGDDVVRGLMVHEIGHHLYHADELGKEAWATAQKEKIAGLLNLVADEHLERNLRAVDDVYGDHLKVLASYAFQHVARDVWLEELLGYLGKNAAPVLTRVPLWPGRKWGSVNVELGKLLAEISSHSSFAQFMRALRQGLGKRDGDERVKAALALFEKKAFRQSKMDWLLEIARELKRIFGDETKILETFGLHETMEASEEDLNEEGFSPDELQRELDKSKNKKAPQKIENPKWNNSPEERFDVIDQIVPLAHRPEEHKLVAEQGRQCTRALRGVFDELGTKIIVEHRRMSGRSLDRQGLASAIVKMDPRLLVRRQPVPAADLFVGIVVDCSGSMASEQSMDKARVFATSLAEAARGKKGVDVRVFGFTDSVIYDAGDADRCAAHALAASGGNNDSAGLWHAAVVAKRSRRKKKLLVMVSDGLPTECSSSSLRALSNRLERGGMLTAQVAVRPISERCFKHYIEILDDDVDDAARRFARVVSKLVRQTVGAR